MLAAFFRIADGTVNIFFKPFFDPIRFTGWQIAAHREGRIRQIKRILLGLIVSSFSHDISLVPSDSSRLLKTKACEFLIGFALTVHFGEFRIGTRQTD